MTESQTYEEKYKEVENLIRHLQNPSLGLDEMIVSVEKGYALIKEMQERLGQTQHKIEELKLRFESDAN